MKNRICFKEAEQMEFWSSGVLDIFPITPALQHPKVAFLMDSNSELNIQ
jgi:hypothetical protein